MEAIRSASVMQSREALTLQTPIQNPRSALDIKSFIQPKLSSILLYNGSASGDRNQQVPRNRLTDRRTESDGEGQKRGERERERERTVLGDSIYLLQLPLISGIEMTFRTEPSLFRTQRPGR